MVGVDVAVVSPDTLVFFLGEPSRRLLALATLREDRLDRAAVGAPRPVVAELELDEAPVCAAARIVATTIATRQYSS